MDIILVDKKDNYFGSISTRIFDIEMMRDLSTIPITFSPLLSIIKNKKLSIDKIILIADYRILEENRHKGLGIEYLKNTITNTLLNRYPNTIVIAETFPRYLDYQGKAPNENDYVTELTKQSILLEYAGFKNINILYEHSERSVELMHKNNVYPSPTVTNLKMDINRYLYMSKSARPIIEEAILKEIEGYTFTSTSG